MKKAWKWATVGTAGLALLLLPIALEKDSTPRQRAIEYVHTQLKDKYHFLTDSTFQDLREGDTSTYLLEISSYDGKGKRKGDKHFVIDSDYAGFPRMEFGVPQNSRDTIYKLE